MVMYWFRLDMGLVLHFIFVYVLHSATELLKWLLATEYALGLVLKQSS